MIAAGCDVGSLTSKAVIMIFTKGSRIEESAVIKSGTKPQESAESVMEEALVKAGMSMEEIDYCIGTGYGREKITFVNEVVTEITCHGKGAHWLLPTARTVIDIGGQDCKAMKIDSEGRILNFVTNDKCASGTGRFLEVMAKVLGLELSELGNMSSKTHSPVTISYSCTVFAQAEVIKLLNSGIPVEDIAAGINAAMAGRIGMLAHTLGLERDVCITGGGAKNIGVVNTLEKIIGQNIKKIRKADPQLAGAIGAAILAKESMESRLKLDCVPVN